MEESLWDTAIMCVPFTTGSQYLLKVGGGSLTLIYR